MIVIKSEISDIRKINRIKFISKCVGGVNGYQFRK